MSLNVFSGIFQNIQSRLNPSIKKEEKDDDEDDDDHDEEKKSPFPAQISQRRPIQRAPFDYDEKYNEHNNPIPNPAIVPVPPPPPPPIVSYQFKYIKDETFLAFLRLIYQSIDISAYDERTLISSLYDHVYEEDGTKRPSVHSLRFLRLFDILPLIGFYLFYSFLWVYTENGKFEFWNIVDSRDSTSSFIDLFTIIYKRTQQYNGIEQRKVKGIQAKKRNLLLLRENLQMWKWSSETIQSLKYRLQSPVQPSPPSQQQHQINSISFLNTHPDQTTLYSQITGVTTYYNNTISDTGNHIAFIPTPNGGLLAQLLNSNHDSVGYLDTMLTTLIKEQWRTIREIQGELLEGHNPILDNKQVLLVRLTLTFDEPEDANRFKSRIQSPSPSQPLPQQQEQQNAYLNNANVMNNTQWIYNMIQRTWVIQSSLNYVVFNQARMFLALEGYIHRKTKKNNLKEFIDHSPNLFLVVCLIRAFSLFWFDKQGFGYTKNSEGLQSQLWAELTDLEQLFTEIDYGEIN